MGNLAVVYLLTIILLSEARDIKIEKCGGGDVKRVDMTPCDAEPCAVKRGDVAVINIPFTSNQDTTSVKVGISAKLKNVELPLPGADSDGCKNKGLTCPLKKGSSNAFTYKLKIQPFYPKINATAKLHLAGINGDLFCVLFPISIVD
ncbi:mite group 2 allergen Gly d 2.02-like [Ornithodoros turicata]